MARTAKCTAGAAVVVNVKRDEFDVYIGRAMPSAKDRRCRRRSPFANPFKVGVHVATAEEAVERFETWIRGELERKPSLRERLLQLRGKRLGCWCAPDPCHGQVLVRLLDEVAERRS